MARFTAARTIRAPIATVWAALADFGRIHRWNPGVVDSWSTSEQLEGVGASRRCHLRGRNYIGEEVVEWLPGERLAVRVTDTNLPIKWARIQFAVSESPNGTRVSVTPIYKMKYGPIGWLLDVTLMRRAWCGGMEALLGGLAAYAEAQSSGDATSLARRPSRRNRSSSSLS